MRNKISACSKAALYCRLSKEDIDKIDKGDDSASIVNQRLLLEDFALEQGFIIYKVYQDDDYSGLFDNRPGFRRMIEDAKEGKFDVIIAKTQSRFTRNMEHMEHYLHDVFPTWGIRFMSIIDNIDTGKQGNKKARQINGLINEWYSEDLSENVRAVFKAKMRQGQNLSSHCRYGYKKDPEDKHKIIIDDYAADIVRMIFNLYIEGNSKHRVACTLNEKDILNPTQYKVQILKLNYYNPRSTMYSKWTAQTVDNILKDEIYIGHLVQNKQTTISYKNRKKVSVPKEERIKVENTHEPIISTEVWEAAQRELKKRTREVKIEKKIDLFTDKLYCPDCGKRLSRKYNKKREFVGYFCSTYKKYGTKGCLQHYCNDKVLHDAVLEEIKRVAKELLTEEDIEELNSVTYTNAVSNNNKQIDFFQEQLNKINIYLEKIYKDYLDEILTREDYIKYREKYNQEIIDLQMKISELNNNTDEQAELMEKKLEWEQKFKNYINIDVLDRIIVNELIDKIEISENGNIHIYFQFRN